MGKDFIIGLHPAPTNFNAAGNTNFGAAVGAAVAFRCGDIKPNTE